MVDVGCFLNHGMALALKWVEPKYWMKRQATHSPSRSADSAKPHWRIFLAEDDPEMRRLIAEAFRKEGHDVFEAADGGQLLVRLARTYAVDHCPDHDVDLIVTDQRMPVCSGLDIVAVLREAHWHTPVIVMTAFGDDSTRERAEKLNAILLDKPFRLRLLQETVDEILS